MNKCPYQRGGLFREVGIGAVGTWWSGGGLFK